MRVGSALFSVVASLVLASACASTRSLPTVPEPPIGVEVVCEKALMSGVVAASESDPRVAWIVAPTGVRVDVAWPFGFSARFEPQGQILARDGSIVATAGDEIRLGGGFHPQTGVFTICEINGRTY